VRVGYLSGTTTHDDDWRHIEAAVVDVVAAHPDAELWLGGHLQPTASVVAALGDRLQVLPFTPWDELPEVLRDLDLNLAPLEPGSRFNDAKSAIKWLEAALVATPTIASPSAPFVDAIEPGRTGWLADHPDEWAGTLALALEDADDRRAVGARARRAALLRWSPHRQADRYVEILEAVRGGLATRRAPSATWSPVVVDEPWLAAPTPLQPYPPGEAPSVPTTPLPAPPSIPTRLRGLAALVRDRLRDEGVLATMQGAWRWVRRRVTPRER
jgi:hypothetical protein